MLDASDDAVLAHRCEWEGGRVVAIHNLSAEPREINVEVGKVSDVDRLVDLLVTAPSRRTLEAATQVKLESYGYRWYRLQRRDTLTTP